MHARARGHRQWPLRNSSQETVAKLQYEHAASCYQSITAIFVLVCISRVLFAVQALAASSAFQQLLGPRPSLPLMAAPPAPTTDAAGDATMADAPGRGPGPSTQRGDHDMLDVAADNDPTSEPSASGRGRHAARHARLGAPAGLHASVQHLQLAAWTNTAQNACFILMCLMLHRPPVQNVLLTQLSCGHIVVQIAPSKWAWTQTQRLQRVPVTQRVCWPGS